MDGVYKVFYKKNYKRFCKETSKLIQRYEMNEWDQKMTKKKVLEFDEKRIRQNEEKATSGKINELSKIRATTSEEVVN